MNIACKIISTLMVTLLHEPLCVFLSFMKSPHIAKDLHKLQACKRRHLGGQEIFGYNYIILGPLNDRGKQAVRFV